MIQSVLASLTTGGFVVCLAWMLIRPRRRLAGRVRPYALGALADLGRPADARSVAHAAGEPAIRRTGFGGALQRAVAAVLLRGEPAPTLVRRLVQADRYDVAPSEVVAEHRVRQVLAALLGGGLAGGAAWVAGAAGMGVLAMGLLGLIAGAARPNAAVDRAIEVRRQRMRAELPPIAQLLALRIRAGGSVTTALATTAQRCHGQIPTDLAEALAQHRAGRALEEVLDATARMTPEPEAARLYRLLSGAVRHGLDVAPELLRVAREGRTTHLTRVRREATRRRGALLLPTIGLLAPMMLLFIAAPLPSIISGS